MSSRTARADVTPVRQRTQYSCMATSMMMCLRALGHDCNEDEVNKVMGATPSKGACWEQALATAQHYGCRATLTCPSTVTQLKGWTDAKKPVMIAWNPEGRDWSHASCVFDVTEGLPEDIPPEAIVQGSGPGLYVWVADSNIPHPEKLIRVVHEDEFYKKWYEKWPQYLVRRAALMLEREISAGGRQMMASSRGLVPRASPDRVSSRYAASQGRLDQRTRSIINGQLDRRGLGGNARFRRAEDGYVLALDILGQEGIELDEVVNSHLFRLDAGTLNIDLAFSNSDDPFSPLSISNSMLHLSYTKLGNDKYEVLTYLT